MEIKGFLELSFQDYDKGACSVIFTSKCNYRCPGCYSKRLLEEKNVYNNEEILNFLEKKEKYINKVVLCGGEPTLELDLIPFVRRLKNRGLEVKLDTNGSNYEVLQELIKENLIDYVAMDIKAPPYLYPKVIGKNHFDLKDNLEKGMGIVSQFPDYEFRTTVIPIVRKNREISFMSVKEIEDIAKFIYETTDNKEHKYFLQPFSARSKEEMIDERFAKENLPEEMHETPLKYLEKCLIEAQKHIPNTKIR